MCFLIIVNQSLFWLKYYDSYFIFLQKKLLKRNLLFTMVLSKIGLMSLVGVKAWWNKGLGCPGFEFYGL